MPTPDIATTMRRPNTPGFRTFILDIPPSRDELAHIMEVFRKAMDLCGNPV